MGVVVWPWPLVVGGVTAVLLEGWVRWCGCSEWWGVGA